MTDIEHSKIWKTFYALVFKPGFLTNEYFAGPEEPLSHSA
ncbi:MAG: DUF3667 domain-containing protein [Blastocatellia bacterium]|nr:DUF3667 domain-containing protein [Blastocatellia bacterium]